MRTTREPGPQFDRLRSASDYELEDREREIQRELASPALSSGQRRQITEGALRRVHREMADRGMRP